MQEITSKKSGKTYFFPTIEEVKEAHADMSGFCLACGEMAYGVEPDACGDECECCGAPRVYGAMEFVLRGWVV